MGGSTRAIMGNSPPPLVLPSGSQWPDRTWPEGVGEPPKFDVLLREIQLRTPLKEKLGPMILKHDAGKNPSPADVVRSIRKNMGTNILTTVYVGGWITTWAIAIGLIGAAYVECS